MDDVSFLNRQWAWLRSSVFHDDDFYMTVIGTNVLIFVWFWLVAGVYVVIDLTGRPEWVQRYKVQAAKQVPADKGRVLNAVLRVLFNQLCLTLPLCVVMYPLGVYMGCTSAAPLPSIWIVIRDFLVIMVVEEFIFYYSHRLFHTPWLYKHVHKLHHDWTAPMGIISLYARPLEHLISNHCAEMTPPLLLGSHLSVAWIWYTAALFVTINNHSGYAIPVVASPHFHDYHHEKFNGNYGSLKLLDWLHGTDKMFKQTMELKRKKGLMKAG